MMESAADFGTGLRAHLGLEQAELELVAAPEAAPEQIAAVEIAAVEVEAVEAVEAEEIAVVAPDRGAMEALEALETELFERERQLAQREASLASRAGSLLAAAQALYDEVLGGGLSPTDDELARMRRRKSLA
jgi:hypothetical protein